MAIRMRDIAQALGVSTVTVSKALNHRGHISDATRKRVLECAKRMDYRTNLAAKGLATGSTKMIGLIVPEIVQGFFSEVAAGLSDHLQAHQYSLIISSSRDQPKLEAEEIRQMLARRVDALIIASCATNAEAFASLVDEVPLILLDRAVPLACTNGFVGTDDVLAGRMATQHLLEIGCRRIAYIGGLLFSPSADREKGYREVLREANLPVRAKYISHLAQNEENTHTTAEKAMQQMLKLRQPPDAVFCYNDNAAYGAMAAILAQGLKIPEDISLIGCGNLRFNGFLRIPLTSIDQHTARLGSEAGRKARSCIQRKVMAVASTDEEHILIKPTLILRESTRPRE